MMGQPDIIRLGVGSFAPGRFGSFMGWSTGLIKEVYVARIEPDDPRLFHVSIKHAAVERLMGRQADVSLRAAGSGFTLSDAFNRAAGEAVERYACCWSDPDLVVLGTWRELSAAGLNPVEPERVALFSRTQYRAAGFPFVPFTRETRVGWVPGWSLVSGEDVHVPAQLVFFQYEHGDGEQPIGYSTSSGCACAESMVEALYRGLCEQIERDAAMITWFARLSPPRVDLDRFPVVLKQFEDIRLWSRTRRFEVRDVTLDIPVPAFLGLATIDLAGSARSFVGGAAGVDPAAAVFRCLLELGQGVPFIKSILIHRPEIDQLTFDNFDDNLRLYADERGQPLLQFLWDNRDISPVRPGGVLKTEALLVQGAQRVADRGLEVIGVDHTTPDVRAAGLVVTRVLVPELVQLGVPALPFLGSRRLYEVPRAMGQDVCELNQGPHPYP